MKQVLTLTKIDGTQARLKAIHFTDSLEVLEYLLNQGADINATDRMSNTLINMVMSRDDNTWANFLIDGEQILQS